MPAAMLSFSNPDSIEKLKQKQKPFHPDWREVMFAIQKTIDSRFRRQLVMCSLSLCLAIPALCAAADSPMSSEVRLCGIIDPPEIPFPPPPPSLGLANPAVRMSGIIDPPEIPFPPPPPSLYRGTAATEQTA